MIEEKVAALAIAALPGGDWRWPAAFLLLVFGLGLIV